jgi:thiopeptide-type bacteriocin biosynthesis protein
VSSQACDFTPSGFFALRTPLLPFHLFVNWTRGLGRADVVGLRERLRTIVTRPEVREAVFLASPDLHESFDVWLERPESERGRRVECALVRYFSRMTGRATPFGLFAGCSVGTLGTETRLTTQDLGSYRRRTRLDMGYLCDLAAALEQDPALRRSLVWRPNTSLYELAGRFRYAEARIKDGVRSYHLVAVEPTDYLRATLVRAAPGARLGELAQGLADDEDVDLEDAEAYVEDLTVSQILVSDLMPPVSGPEPILDLMRQLREEPTMAPVVACLESAFAEMESIDARGVGVPLERYLGLARGLEALPVKANPSRLFQVDMLKPAPQATLGPDVMAEVRRGVELLHRLTPPLDDPLLGFRERFLSRYGERAVPLVEALDEESGIGLAEGPAFEDEPLLRRLTFPKPGAAVMKWGPREAHLARLVESAQRTGAREIVLEDEDLKKLENEERLPLPEAFAAGAVIDLPAGADFRREFRLFCGAVLGPSGAFLLGRFCHADADLHRSVESHLRTEEAVRPDAIYAEIVHQPEGRTGNVLFRPRLRAHEIHYLGRSEAVGESRISVTDLDLSVREGRFILRSRRNGREIIPRLTNAHEARYGTVGLYRFLWFLQYQGVAGALYWPWGALESLTFLPRVRVGRVILSLARWLVARGEIPEPRAAHRSERVGRWREARSIPRWVTVGGTDQEFVVDLENPLSVDALCHVVRGHDEFILRELFPQPPDDGADDKSFVHEVIIPFGARGVQHRRSPGAAPTVSVRRTFVPGSEWLYLKVYTGTTTADELLRTDILELVARWRRSAGIDRWFFVRYADPEWHLRIRFHGNPNPLDGRALEAFYEALAPALRDGRVWRIAVDTYEREVERYGGPEGMEISEAIFEADSDAVLALLQSTAGESALDSRWRLALASIDRLLTDFGLTLTERAALIDRASTEFGREQRVTTGMRREIGAILRQERGGLRALLQNGSDTEESRVPILERSHAVTRLARQLAMLAAEGRLNQPKEAVILSHVHMSVNRLLRSSHRMQEAVLYDLLARLYRADLARTRT